VTVEPRYLRAAAGRIARLAAVAGILVTAATTARAQNEDERARPDLPDAIFDEMRIGAAKHDVNVLGSNKEDGADIIFDVRLPALEGGLWDSIARPRPHIGANVSTARDTSQLYFGLTWAWHFLDPFFVSVDLGGSLHDGDLKNQDPGRKELGSRVLFRQALELGIVMFERHAISVRLDHASNANLADRNEGINSLGVVYGLRF